MLAEIQWDSCKSCRLVGQKPEAQGAASETSLGKFAPSSIHSRQIYKQHIRQPFRLGTRPLLHNPMDLGSKQHLQQRVIVPTTPAGSGFLGDDPETSGTGDADMNSPCDLAVSMMLPERLGDFLGEPGHEGGRGTECARLKLRSTPVRFVMEICGMSCSTLQR